MDRTEQRGRYTFTQPAAWKREVGRGLSTETQPSAEPLPTGRIADHLHRQLIMDLTKDKEPVGSFHPSQFRIEPTSEIGHDLWLQIRNPKNGKLEFARSLTFECVLLGDDMTSESPRALTIHTATFNVSTVNMLPTQGEIEIVKILDPHLTYRDVYRIVHAFAEQHPGFKPKQTR